jgi:hypothetical protein
MRILFLFFFVGLICSYSFGQEVAVVKGKVIEYGNKAPVVGAKIVFNESLKIKTDIDGNYMIDVPYGKYTVIVSMISFDTMRLDLNVNEPIVLFNIELGNVQEITEVKVVGNIASDRKTPVAVSNLGKKEISEELGSQDLPMILNTKPGIHATQQGGGDGDARITIRGFDQRNVGVMIDGVPVNDMENGWVYWSNWFGLDAITQQIQVQRGLGATKLAMPSVGGTMNIITDNTGGKREIKVNQEYGTGANSGEYYGSLNRNGDQIPTYFSRTSLSYKSGTLKNGWGVLFSGSYKQGNGWVEGLNTQGGFYYLKIQKKVKDHVISLSGFGAPQQHGQRSFNQPIEYWDKNYARGLFKGSDDLYAYMANYYQNQGSISSSQYYAGLQQFGYDSTSIQPIYQNFADTTGGQDFGVRHNEHWGYYTDTVSGRTVVKNERRNYFHKPQITLKDFWQVNKKLSWSNKIYASIGRGGGTRAKNSSAITFDENGHIDWDTIEYSNRYITAFGQTFTTADATYDPTLFKSSQVLTSSVNNHFWTGALSQFDYEVNEHWKVSGGLDYRYYKGTHYVELYDLLGGDYWVNNANQNDANLMKKVGDKVGWETYQNHRDAIVQWIGGFGQAEYEKGRWTAFVNASTVTNGYNGIDYFEKKELHDGDSVIYVGATDTVTYNGKVYTNDSPELQYSQTGYKWLNGFTIKTGANFNVTERSNIFMNVGLLNRTPQYSNVIDNNTNTFFVEILNEKIYAAEVGYGFRSKKLSINANGYFTYWENKPFPFGVSIPDPNDPTTFVQANINGMDARHMGIEFDAAYVATKKITLEGMVSLGDWTWQSSETVNVLGQLYSFDAKGVHVGDAAQSTYAGTLRYDFVKRGYIKFKYTYFDRYYSNFDPFSLTGANGGRESWQIPSYGLLSLHAGYTMKFDKCALILKANVFNLLNTIYISDARNNQNGSGFNADDAGVFMGPGMTLNFSLGFEF